MIWVDGTIHLKVVISGKNESLFMNFKPDLITECIVNAKNEVVTILYKGKWYEVNQPVLKDELKQYCKKLI